MQKLVATAIHLTLATLIVSGLVISGAAHADEEPMQVHSKSATVDCSHRDVNVFSQDAKLKFTGPCKQIYFIGNNTEATVESATMLQFTAGSVTVTVGDVAEVYAIGEKIRLNAGAVGDIHLNGNLAVINAKSIENVSGVGRNNKVTWRTGSPEINDMGTNNTLEPAAE